MTDDDTAAFDPAAVLAKLGELPEEELHQALAQFSDEERDALRSHLETQSAASEWASLNTGRAARTTRRDERSAFSPAAVLARLDAAMSLREIERIVRGLTFDEVVAVLNMASSQRVAQRMIGGGG